jgi:hypothetical protein
MLVWPNFGNTVYLLDDTYWTCKAIAYPNGPADSGTSAIMNGTFGRFRYFPDQGVYAVVRAADTNAYVLRLTAPQKPH